MTATLHGDALTPTGAAGATAAAHVAAANAATGRFFETNADLVARACHAMALRFRAGGRLLAYGEGAQRSDVAHVVVEFVHPVIVGKRALPALALQSPEMLDTMGHDEDVLMLFSAGPPDAAASALLDRARARRMLVLALTGSAPASGYAPAEGAAADADELRFAVPSDDPLVVQETQEALYHVLWELVHVFLEHREGRS